MFYAAVFVPLGIVTVLVLAAVGWRLWRQVRQLGREVAAASDRIGRASAELQRLAPPDVRR